MGINEVSSQEELNNVLIKVQRAKDFCAPWHTNIRRWRRRYNFDHYDKKAKSGENRFIDPTHTNTVDLAVGILQSNEMIWRATGWKPSAEEESGGSIVEKTVAAIIDLNSARKQIDMKYEVNTNFVRDGGACLYSYWDKDVHSECFDEQVFPQEDGSEVESRVYYELPLRVEIIDPLNIHLLPGGARRWLAVAHIENVSVYDIEQLYDMSLPEYKHLTQTEKIEQKNELIDYWEYAYEIEPDDEYTEEMSDDEKIVHIKRKPVVRNAVIYGQRFIKNPKVMPGYKSLPYRVNFYNPTSMTDSSMWHGILSPQEQSVKELEESINMRKRLLALYSNMPLVAVTRDGRPIQIDPALGTAISLQEGEDMGFPKWEGTPPDFDKQIDLLRSRIQQSGFSDVMYGQGPSGVSGYALSQMGDQNRIRLMPAITHLENLWTWAARDWLDLIKEYAPEYYFEIYGHIRGADFAEMVLGSDLGGYQVRCIIKPEFPNEKVRAHAMATQASQFLSFRRIAEEYLGVQQPDLEREQKLQELAEEMPLAKQYALMAKLEEKAMAGDEIAMQVLQMMQQEMMGAQQGRPEEPRNPEQPMGLQSASGEAQPQQFQGQEDVRAIQQMATAAPQMVSGGVE